MHYDDLHLIAWYRSSAAKTERRPPARRSEHVVFRACQNVQRRELNQRLRLPASVKEILRSPADESRWEVLERLRVAVVAEVLQEGSMALSQKDAEALARGIEACTSSAFADEVGPGCVLLPAGSRVLLDVWGEGTVVERRLGLAAAARTAERVRYQTRPLGTSRQAPLSTTARTLAEAPDVPLRQLADLSAEHWMDELLLALWDALFLAQATDWSNRRVANLPAWETLELARWWLRGQKVGESALFDGLCAMCAGLLFGTVGGCSLSNKASGPPCDRDGKPIDDVGAAPPCFLRYSPALFASEAPAIFAHDPVTNRLSLRPGVPEPWLRHRRGVAEPTEWLYCQECQSRWFPAGGQRQHSHVPFRDRAATASMKPVMRRYQPTGRAGPQQAAEAREDSGSEGSAVVPEEPPPPEDEDDGADVEMEPLEEGPPQEPRPSLAEYEAKWKRAEAEHALLVPGLFSRDNLAPKPVPQLWQDCPHVPFADLKSDESQARLAVTRPISGLEEASVAEGVPRYAHNTGPSSNVSATHRSHTHQQPPATPTSNTPSAPIQAKSTSAAGRRCSSPARWALCSTKGMASTCI